jgi:hypothetical protein
LKRSVCFPYLKNESDKQIRTCNRVPDHGILGTPRRGRDYVFGKHSWFPCLDGECNIPFYTDQADDLKGLNWINRKYGYIYILTCRFSRKAHGKIPANSKGLNACDFNSDNIYNMIRIIFKPISAK